MTMLADLSLQLLLIDGAFYGFMLLVGVGAGWLLSPRSANSRQVEHAEQAIETLRGLASTVARDVGEHASQMQAINTELSNAQSGGNPASDVVSHSLAVILRANEQLQEKLAVAEVMIQRQEEELKTSLAAARTDALTGVSNRRAFDDELGRRIAEWTRRHTLFSLVMLDVDHFKKFNDQYGHQAGDEVLRGVARTLKQTMREMDFVGRYGGEEFAAILPVTNQKEAVIAAQRIRSAVEAATFTHEGIEFHVTCSLGVAQVIAANTPADMIKRADAALYLSKASGRNCVHYHDGEMCRPASEALEVPLPPTVPGEAILPPVKLQQREETACECDSGFHADLRRRVAEARKFCVPFSLMMLEIDHFEDLSEKHGIATGDQVYDTIADFLRAVLQEMDVAARSGDGQFAIMLPGTDLESAIGLAERLRTTVEGYAMQVNGLDLRMTLSAGVADILDNDDSSTLTRRAAAALFAARQNGANCTCIHNGERCEIRTAVLA